MAHLLKRRRGRYLTEQHLTRLLLIVLAAVFVFTPSDASADVVQAFTVVQNLVTGQLMVLVATIFGGIAAYKYFSGSHDAHDSAMRWVVGAGIGFGVATLVTLFR